MSVEVPPADPLGAFCRDNHVSLPPLAAGVLSGTTFAVKDVFDIAGTRTGFGNPDWLATHAPATRTAPVVLRLLTAGASMLGRSVSDELTYSLTGENAHYGTPVNPAAPERVPGGSSSGSASAVAGGLVDFALGTDCGGSVRLPASYCGVIGLRPSHGRVDSEGVIPFAPSFDVVGWFARDIRIMLAVGRLVLGADLPASAPMRAWRSADAFERVSPAVRQALEPALAGLTELLGPVADLSVADTGLPAWYEVFRVLQGYEIWRERRAWIESVEPRIGPGIRERLAWAATLTEDQGRAARAARERIRARLDQLLPPGEFLCLPTSPRVAPLKNEPQDKLELEYRQQAMRLLCIAGLGGLPQVSLPLATLDGLPLGFSLVGARGTDCALLELASALLGACAVGAG